MKHGSLIRPLLGLAVLSSVLLVSSLASAQETDIVVETDIVYVTRGDRDLLLDVARPASQDGEAPAVVFFHGWGNEGKDAYRDWIAAAAARGYVGVSVGYRLPTASYSETRFPAAVHDAKSAVRWLRANADRYGVNPDQIGVVGFSFGAYLALLLAFTGPSDALEGAILWPGVSSNVQAVVAAGAPVDWAYEAHRTDRGPETGQLMQAFLGGLPEEVPDRYRASDPREYIGPRDAPVLAIHGGQDGFAPLVHGQLLQEVMVARGASHSFLVVPKGTHSFLVLASPSFEYPTWSFLGRYLKGK